MLRFLPDSWWEALLRPFILMDPSTGIYFEEAAPDARFAAFFVFMLVALMARRGALRQLSAEQGRLLVGLPLMLYVWTLVIGNGRYFAAGLLLVGPALVLAWRLLPGTLSFRVLALAGVAGLQLFAIQQVYQANHWGLVKWQDGPGLAIEDSPLRNRPAVFLTITGISYSLLVPKFHPESRWANITGQRTIGPTAPEYPRLQALLAAPLPKYVMVPVNEQFMSADRQPTGDMHTILSDALAAQGQAMTGQACTILRSNLNPRAVAKGTPEAALKGFWFCPVQASEEARVRAAAGAKASHELDDVFLKIEQRCPRFFPPGGGSPGRYPGFTMRHYPGSDVRLYVEDGGRVLYRYFRALNPTLVGSVDQVRRGDFQIACDKLAGRYVLPWQRD